MVCVDPVNAAPSSTETNRQNEALTSGGSLRLLCLLAVQILEQLHGLPGHDNLLEDRFKEGHHGELSAPRGLIPPGAPAGRVIQLLLTVHRLRYAVQRVGGVPEVPVIHGHVFVPAAGERNSAHKTLLKSHHTHTHGFCSAPLDDEFSGRVKQMAVNDPLVYDLQIRPDRLRPQGEQQRHLADRESRCVCFLPLNRPHVTVSHDECSLPAPMPRRRCHTR